MLGIQEFGVFIATAIILNLTPGSDTFYILGRSVALGRRAGIASVLGISTGSLVHTLAAALGLSALLVASSSAFLVVKLLGAAYLVFLGIRMILSKSTEAAIPSDFAPSPLFSIYRQGVITNVLNPKVALFFLALVPQFIATDSPSKFVAFMVLGLCFIATGTLWCFCLVWFSSLLTKRIRKSESFSRILNRSAGALFVSLGVKLAVAK
ncbi:LysE family translocator [Rubritalea sp.]|uniref:LysE family translocator n=1 Tax=Rubritalea sp. TaxID=2109375 RepID=UPI003EF280A0